MIPFDPFDVHVLWWKTWRNHIEYAKTNPPEVDGYCMAAAIAQVQYVTALAIKINKLKKEGINCDE